MKISTLFTRAEYVVGYRFCDNDIIDDTKAPFKILYPEKGIWYADPFAYCYKDEYYVFMEVFVNANDYAYIGCSKLVNGELTKPEPVIDYGLHLSFPFVFDYNGEIYMMPESCGEHKIKLFKCIEFPNKWEECYSITDERLFYDSVVFEDNDKRYLLTSHKTEEMYGSRLYLMELENGTMTPSILSEKVLTDDSTKSREAGKMIRKNGKLIRVVQDCSKKEYGRALGFYEIDNLENYSEHRIKYIKPKQIKTETKVHGKIGVHTYNRVNNFDVIDLKVGIFYPKALFIKLKILFDIIFSKFKR